MPKPSAAPPTMSPPAVIQEIYHQPKKEAEPIKTKSISLGSRNCSLGNTDGGSQPKRVLVPENKNQAFLKSKGNACMCCLRRILMGVGGRRSWLNVTACEGCH